MARVKYQKARKDYPNAGIKKGDQYYYARIKTGPYSSREIRSLKPIPRSQLTTSAFLGQAYDLEDRFAALSSCPLSDLESELQSLAEDARSLGEEEQEKYDNMESEAPGLAQGDTGQMIQARAEGMTNWADSLESVANNVQEKVDEVAEATQAWEDYQSAKYDWDQGDGEDDEPDEPDVAEPDQQEIVSEILNEVDDLSYDY